MNEQEIQRRVKELVGALMAGADDPTNEQPIALLGEAGVFDSVSALELVLALEREFGIVIRDHLVNGQNLGSIDAICRFVQQLISESSGGTVRSVIKAMPVLLWVSQI